MNGFQKMYRQLRFVCTSNEQTKRFNNQVIPKQAWHVNSRTSRWKTKTGKFCLQQFFHWVVISAASTIQLNRKQRNRIWMTGCIKEAVRACVDVCKQNNKLPVRTHLPYLWWASAEPSQSPASRFPPAAEWSEKERGQESGAFFFCFVVFQITFLG